MMPDDSLWDIVTDAPPAEGFDELRTRIAAWGHPHAAQLRAEMDDELARRSGNVAAAGDRRVRASVDPSSVLLTVLVYDAQDVVATATLQETEGRYEVTRLYVVPSHRRRGLARRVLGELDEYARAAGVPELVMALDGQHREASSLCARDGWVRIAPYGGHDGVCVASRVDTGRVGASIARAGIV